MMPETRANIFLLIFFKFKGLILLEDDYLLKQGFVLVKNILIILLYLISFEFDSIVIYLNNTHLSILTQA